MNPKVSVITPICNVERYLPECLESLLSQTLNEIEFLWIDDGSKDNSGAIADEFAAKDARVRVVHKPNSGYGATMNLGLSLAKGEFIGIVESDDFAEPTMFQSLYEKAIKNHCDIVRSNRFTLTDKGNSFTESLKGLPYGKVITPTKNCLELFDKAPDIWSAIYKREFLTSNSIDFQETPGAAFQDTGFVYKSYIAADRVLFVKDAYLHYRKNNESSSVNSSSHVYDVMSEFASIDEFVASRKISDPRFCGVYTALRFQAYVWNYNRLSASNQRAFINAISKEFKELQSKGTIVRNNYSSPSWELLQQIISDPNSVTDSHLPAVRILIPPTNYERAIRKLRRLLK